MQAFRQNVTRIKGLSDRRRMPLLGKVRLGIKKKNKKGVEYPAETDFFVVDDAVKELYGPEPKKLDVMFPMNDIDAVFPTAYIFYGSGRGVKCKGDGEKAWCVDPENKEIIEKECPCPQLESGKCKQVGRLLFMIPSVSVAGVFQLSTSSFNSIIDIQSGIDYVQAMVGRFAFIDLELKRVPTITHHDNKKQTHYTIQLTLPATFNLKALSDLKADNERIYTQAQFQLPAPKDENPELDPVDIVADEESPPLETEQLAVSRAKEKGVEIAESSEPETTQPETSDYSGPDIFRSEYVNLKVPGLSTWVFKNKARIVAADTKDRQEIKEKWENFYPDNPWLLDEVTPETPKTTTPPAPLGKFGIELSFYREALGDAPVDELLNGADISKLEDHEKETILAVLQMKTAKE